MPQWKAFERQVAKLFKVFRTPLSGSSSHLTTGDIVHPVIFAECKYRKTSAVCNLFDETRIKAKHEGKTPMVALKQHGQRGFLLVIDSRDLQIFLREVKNAD